MGKKKGQGKDKNDVVTTEPAVSGFSAGAKGKRHGAGRGAMPVPPEETPDGDTSSAGSGPHTPPKDLTTAGASNPMYGQEGGGPHDTYGLHNPEDNDLSAAAFGLTESDEEVVEGGPQGAAGYLQMDGLDDDPAGHDGELPQGFLQANDEYKLDPREKIHVYDNSGDEADEAAAAAGPAGDDMYDMSTASPVIQAVRNTPRGGIALKFINANGWNEHGATFRLEFGGSPHRVWSSSGEEKERGQLMPGADGSVELSAAQLQGLTLHQAADGQPWQSGKLVFGLYEKGSAAPKEVFNIFINPEQIAKQEAALEAKQAHLQVMKAAANVAGADGYLESQTAPAKAEFDDIDEMLAAADAEGATYDMGGDGNQTRTVVAKAENVHLVLQGVQIAYQIALPEAPKKMVTLTAEEQRRRDEKLKQRAKREALEQLKREAAEKTAQASVFNERIDRALADVVDNALFVTLGKMLQDFQSTVLTDDLYTGDKAEALQGLIGSTAQGFVKTLYQRRGLKFFVNAMLEAGCSNTYTSILERLSESESAGHMVVLKCLKCLPDFFTTNVQLDQIDLPAEAAKLAPYFKRVVKDIGQQASDYDQYDATLVKRFIAIDASLTGFEKQLSVTLNDETKMPDDFEKNLDQYMKGDKKNKALRALFKSELTSLCLHILGGRPQAEERHQQGVKEVIDERIKKSERNIRNSILAFGGNGYKKAKDCLALLPKEFFEKTMLALTKDESYGFEDSYEAAPDISPEDVVKPALEQYLWRVVTHVLYQEKLINATAVIAQDLIDASEGKKSNTVKSRASMATLKEDGPGTIAINRTFPGMEAAAAGNDGADAKGAHFIERDAEAVAEQLTQLKAAVNQLKKTKMGDEAIQGLLRKNDGKHVIANLLADQKTQVNEKTFLQTLLDGEESAEGLITAYEQYFETVDAFGAERKAAEKRHEQQMRRAKVAGLICCTLVLGAGGIAGWLATQAGDDAAPGAQSAPSVGYDFDTACAQSTQFTPAELAQVAHALGFGTLMIGGVIGQHLFANLTGVTNAAFEAILDAAPHVAFRVKTPAGVTLETGVESVQAVTVANTEGLDGRTNYSIVSRVLFNVSNTADLLFQRLTAANISDTSNAGCHAGSLPLQIDPLSNFASASTNTSSFLALSNNQPRPLGFDYQLNNPLPAGLTLQARVTGITNGILQRADGSFVTGGTNGEFPVALGDVSGLQFLATQGYQGLVTPTLVLEVFDPNANNGVGAVINLADARVTQSLNIDYVVPLNAPTLSVTMPAVNEGAAANLDVDVFLDPGVTGVTVEKIIQNIPVGTRLVSGSNTYVATDPVATNNVVDVTSWGDGDIAVSRVNPNDNGLYPLTVVARSTRVATGETTQSQQTIQAQFNAVSDVMNIHTNTSVALTEGADLVMPLRLSPAGGASDVLTGLTLSGLPAGTVVTDAPHGSSLITQTVTVPANGDANIFSWTNDWAQERQVYLHFPPFYHGGAGNQLSIGVQATSQDGSSAPAVNNGALAVNFTPVSNAIAINQAPDVARFQGNGTIPCGWSIDASTVDPSEVHVAQVHGIVNGSTLIDTQTNATIPVSAQGVGTVQLAQIPHLGIRPDDNFAGTLTPELRISSQFGSSPPALTSDAFTIRLNSNVGVPNLSVSPVTGNEDATINIGSGITVSTNAPDEVLEVHIAGVPAGAQLSFGTLGGDGIWRITTPADLANIANLNYTGVQHFSGTRTLQITAQATRNTETESVTQSMALTISPQADTPSISTTDAQTNEDSAVSLSFTGTLVDPSETLSYRISNVSNGALDVGTNQGNGVWTLTAAQAQNVRFVPAHHWAGTQVLQVEAVSTESDGTQAISSPQSLSVAVTAQVDAATVTSPSTVNGQENSNGINLSPQITVIDESQQLTIEVQNLPASIGSLSGGFTRVGSTYTLASQQVMTQAQVNALLNGIQFIPNDPQNWSGTQQITWRVTSREQSTGVTQVRTHAQTVNVAGVPDQPTAVGSLSSLSGTATVPRNIMARLDFSRFATDPQEDQTFWVRVPSSDDSISGSGVTSRGSRWYEVSQGASAVYNTNTPGTKQLTVQPRAVENGQTALRTNTLTISVGAAPTAPPPPPATTVCTGARCRRDVDPFTKASKIATIAAKKKSQETSVYAQLSETWAALWQQPANEPAVNKGNVAQNEAPLSLAVHG